MATRLTPFGMVIKWFVVPIVLCAIGYFLVGPRVESKVPAGLKEKVREAASPAEGKAGVEGSETKESGKTYAVPEVDVTVTALNSREDKPKKKRRRRKKPTPAPSTTAPPPSEAPSVSPPPSTSDGA